MEEKEFTLIITTMPKKASNKHRKTQNGDRIHCFLLLFYRISVRFSPTFVHGIYFTSFVYSFSYWFRLVCSVYSCSYWGLVRLTLFFIGTFVSLRFTTLTLSTEYRSKKKRRKLIWKKNKIKNKRQQTNTLEHEICYKNVIILQGHRNTFKSTEFLLIIYEKIHQIQYFRIRCNSLQFVTFKWLKIKLNFHWNYQIRRVRLEETNCWPEC